MREKFYITTPIYYVNDRPHVGHLYATLVADILARFHRMRGDMVQFVTGTDDNAQKNAEAAEKVGKEVGEYVCEMSALWERTWDELRISHDIFIRTSSVQHKAAVEKFFRAVEAQGDIYRGSYEGWYCVGCEAYKTASEMDDGKCLIHHRELEHRKEENYFFRASRYRDAILAHIQQHPEFIEPESRRNEVVNFVRDHLEDFSISRKNNGWGIPVPGDESHTLYVWFDALINYVTAAGYPKDKTWWPADLHVVGKDLIKFHCGYWPAMLLSAGLPLPKKVFAHGFFTIEGEKISKSLGNAIDPLDLTARYGIEPVRWYLIRALAFGEDGDFKETGLRERYDAELANGIGNLVARVMAMAEQYCDGVVPAPTKSYLHEAWPAYLAAMHELRFDRAAEVVWTLLGVLDRYVDSEQPWVLHKLGEHDRLRAVLYNLLESIRHVAWMLIPLLPATADAIFDRLGILKNEKTKTLEKARAWAGLKQGTKIHKGEALFPK